MDRAYFQDSVRVISLNHLFLRQAHDHKVELNNCTDKIEMRTLVSVFELVYSLTVLGMCRKKMGLVF